METRARFTVDAAHCQRAADELRAMLWQQERTFLERYNALGVVKVAPRVLVVIGLVMSVLALLLCVLSLVADPYEWPRRPETWAIPVFVAMILVFAFSSRLIRRLQAWTFGVAERRSRRHAEKLLKIAKQLAPYEAEYDFKGTLLTYSRGKGDEWTLAWVRNLDKFRAKGVAMQASSVTVIFRRPRSFLPSVLILHTDVAWTSEVLRAVQIKISEFPSLASSDAARS